MSRLYRAIQKAAPRPDRAGFGIVTAVLGSGRYQVNYGAGIYILSAAGDADALPGEQVALLIAGATGKPIAMLGRINP